MDDALVVIDDRESTAGVLREAAAYATGADTELVLYVPLSEDEFEESLAALDEIGRVENKDYSDEDALSVAQQYAEDVTAEALEGFDVAYSVVTDVTEEVEAERVIEIADERDCDHVFTVGRQRSPTGKAVFGDTTQRLVLNFPGYVTVQMA
ncbi:universal stress protein [Halobacterium noricense]|uniref:universal stress protein n=1 Tax=Halobacterium noricense TaxID=223182 RepID=UPI001E3744EC|nr:universal stress protein [Halobacterium noricense]UHH23938.1 universal stress protein [Halobacterium noricense]